MEQTGLEQFNNCKLFKYNLSIAEATFRGGFCLQLYKMVFISEFFRLPKELATAKSYIQSLVLALTTPVNEGLGMGIIKVHDYTRRRAYIKGAIQFNTNK